MKTKLIYSVHSEKDLVDHLLEFNPKMDKISAIKVAIETSKGIAAHYNNITKSLQYRLEVEEHVKANGHLFDIARLALADDE